MKLYCYTYHADKILKNGYLSVAANSNPAQLIVYASKAGSNDFEEIKKYLENTVPGRTKSISCLTEMAPVKEYEHPYLNYLVHHASIISFDLNELMRDSLVETIYCKDCSKTAMTKIEFENIYKIQNISEIDTSPLNWHECCEKYGSPYNILKHYILILTKECIPPEYITLEYQGDNN